MNSLERIQMKDFNHTEKVTLNDIVTSYFIWEMHYKLQTKRDGILGGYSD